MREPVTFDEMAAIRKANRAITTGVMMERGYRRDQHLGVWKYCKELDKPLNEADKPQTPYVGTDGETHDPAAEAAKGAESDLAGHEAIESEQDAEAGTQRHLMVASAKQHSLAALEDIASGKEYGTLHNATYGEIRYPRGRPGKGGLGFLHIVEHRMNGGATLDEAIETATRVGMAAEIGEETASILNTRHFEYDGVRAIVAIREDDSAVITGYEIDADETAAAVRRAEEHKPHPHVSSDEVIRRLQERLARERNLVNSENPGRQMVSTARPTAAALDGFMAERGFVPAFHGTTGRWRKLKLGDAGHGVEAFYLSADRGTAESYAALRSLDTGEAEKPNVRKFYVRDGNVKRVRDEDWRNMDGFREMLRQAQEDGYDAVFDAGALDDQYFRLGKKGEIIYPEGEEAQDEAGPTDIWVVFNPQILVGEAQARRLYAEANRRPSPEFAMDGTIVDALPAHLREDARAIIAERANTPAWMVEPDGTPTDLNERDWLRREAEARHAAGRRLMVSGLFTGTSANYAIRDENGNIVNGPSLHYVGSGEKTAVFGYGLYASKRRDIAESYMRKVTGAAIRDFERTHGDEGFYPYEVRLDGIPQRFDVSRTGIGPNAYDEAVALAVLSTTGSVGEAISELEERYRTKSKRRRFNEYPEVLLDAVRWLKERRMRLECAPMLPQGHLYEQTFFTNRATPEETERHLLKWYEPVSGEQKEWILARLEKEGRATPYLKEALEDAKTGREVYELLAEELVEPEGFIQERTQYGTGAKRGEQSASEFLARADIDGVKMPVFGFQTNGAANGDEVGWNYVSFRDDNIRVDHKWVAGKQRYQIAGRTGAERLGIRGLGDAEAMERSGATREEIWRETGWWRGIDGKWRVEIGDIQAKGNGGEVHIEGEDAWCRLGDMVDAPELFAAYPGLENSRINLVDPAKLDGLGGYYAGGTITISRDGVVRDGDGMTSTPNADGIKTLTHELQHMIQHAEGFDTGTNVTAEFERLRFAQNEGAIAARLDFEEMIIAEIVDAMPDDGLEGDELDERNATAATAAIAELEKAVRENSKRSATALVKKALKGAGVGEKAAKEAAGRLAQAFEKWRDAGDEQEVDIWDARRAYLASPGEVEARASEVRRQFDDYMRGEFPPWVTEGIVRRDSWFKRADRSISAHFRAIREANGGAEARRYAVAPSGAQKQAGTAYPDAGAEIDRIGKPLIAVHGLSTENLVKAIDAGFFVNPSIALVTEMAGWDKGGFFERDEDASAFVIFGKPTIDQSTVYEGDAGTPTFGDLAGDDIGALRRDWASASGRDAPSDIERERLRLSEADKQLELARKIRGMPEGKEKRKLLKEWQKMFEKNGLLPYSEAKPWRNVPLSEAAAVLVGKKLDAETKAKIKAAGFKKVVEIDTSDPRAVKKAELEHAPHFAIGANRRKAYEDLLAKKRPDLDAGKVLAELDKYDNPKKEKAALHWVIRGAVQLPEDEYKVDEALSVAAKAKVDPFAYASPMELIRAQAGSAARTCPSTPTRCRN